MLNKYLMETTRLIRDFHQQDVDPRDLISYINTARREIAGRTQCIRRLTPICGQVVSIDVDDGGSGYTDTPTITISAPDFPSAQAPYPQGAQATAEAIVNNGVIEAINVTFGGSGYFQPTVTIEDDTGTGATATANVPGLNILNVGQEVYNFSDINLEAFPGVEAVIAIRSVAVIYSNLRYALTYRSFSVYQAKIRSYTQQYQYTPVVYTQFGQGTEGSFYVFPYPSQILQAEFDCLCLPSDLTDDQSPEAIPNMWRDGVKWYAASQALFSLQNFQAATILEGQFDKYLKRYGDYSAPGRALNQYGNGRR